MRCLLVHYYISNRSESAPAEHYKNWFHKIGMLAIQFFKFPNTITCLLHILTNFSSKRVSNLTFYMEEIYSPELHRSSLNISAENAKNSFTFTSKEEHCGLCQICSSTNTFFCYHYISHIFGNEIKTVLPDLGLWSLFSGWTRATHNTYLKLWSASAQLQGNMIHNKM